MNLFAKMDYIPEMIIFVFATLILAFIVKNLTDIAYNVVYVQSC